MQRINYGLIISDFDGTLVNDDGSILESTKEQIIEYRQQGGAFAISTGRLPNGILNRAEELGLKGAVSCCHGAVIVDIESNPELEYNKKMQTLWSDFEKEQHKRRRAFKKEL